MKTILNLNGKPLSKNEIQELYYIEITSKDKCALRGIKDSLIIDNAYVNLIQKIKTHLFTRAEIEITNYKIPVFASEAGYNSDCGVSKELFEKFISDSHIQDYLITKMELNKFLYYQDIIHLLYNMQNATTELSIIINELYYCLFFELRNTIPRTKNGTYWTRSSETIKIHSLIQIIFIRIYSLFDYSAKLLYELINIKTEFSKYHSLCSKNILYHDSKKLKNIDIDGSLFEPSENIKLIEELRNYIIHHGTLEDSSRVYQTYKDGDIIEKFILYPDSKNGKLETYKNRKTFYGEGKRINEDLPIIYNDILCKLEKTISIIGSRLKT